MNLQRIVISFALILALVSCASEYQIEGNSSVARLDGKLLFVKVAEIPAVVIIKKCFKSIGFHKIIFIIF